MKRLVAWSLAIGTLIASITTTAIFVVRHKNARSASSHLVDLGYAIYRGHDNLANGLHEWLVTLLYLYQECTRGLLFKQSI